MMMTNNKINHQQVSCSKVWNIDHMMPVVVSIANYICSRRLKHRTIRAFLEAVDAECKDLLYNAKVHQLSRGRVLQRAVVLKEESTQSLENYTKYSQRWKMRTGTVTCTSFVTLQANLNEFNLQLQEKNKIFQINVAAFKLSKLN
jgi:hypothetical protein